jgi:cell division septation protein DedD
MNKSILFFLLAGLLLCTGCDYIRASLGKPTSADLVKISDELKAREQFLRDSIAAVRAAEAGLAAQGDTLASQAPVPAASAVQPAVQPAQPAPAQPAAAAPLKKYYAVAGAFKNPEGAQKYVNKLQENGIKVHLVDFRSGPKVVCVEGHDTLEEAQQDVARLKELKLSDSDPWIYNTNQKLHK